MIPHDVRACLVDLDGTLYRSLPLKLAMAAELLLFGVPVISTLLRFRREHELPAVGTANPFEDQLERTARALGRPVEGVRDAVDRWMFRRPAKWIAVFRRRKLLAELEAFRERGGRLALVSDYPVRSKIDQLKLQFDVTVSSGEPGGPARLKPDPEGYLSAARALGVEPRHCLVIGDRDDRDGEAARRAGMAFRKVP
jgi:putative hydrolase of the HAD superfamily